MANYVNSLYSVLLFIHVLHHWFPFNPMDIYLFCATEVPGCHMIEPNIPNIFYFFTGCLRAPENVYQSKGTGRAEDQVSLL